MAAAFDDAFASDDDNVKPVKKETLALTKKEVPVTPKGEESKKKNKKKAKKGKASTEVPQKVAEPTPEPVIAPEEAAKMAADFDDAFASDEDVKIIKKEVQAAEPKVAPEEAAQMAADFDDAFASSEDEVKPVKKANA